MGASVWAGSHYWEDITDTTKAEAYRAIALAVAAAIAIWMALWRGVLTNRQSVVSHNTLLNQRYQDGARMIGHELLAVRLAGIHALAELAKEHPERYHLATMHLFCGFVRQPPQLIEHDQSGADQRQEDLPKDPSSEPAENRDQDNVDGIVLGTLGDVGAILTAIQERTSWSKYLESRVNYRLDLRGAYLAQVRLSEKATFDGAILDGAILNYAHLPEVQMHKASLKNAEMKWVFAHQAKFGGAKLTSAILENADLTGANLESTILRFANLSNAILHDVVFDDETDLTGTNLSGTDFGDELTTLTQAQLDKAKADVSAPRIPESATDPLTGLQLVWNQLQLGTEPEISDRES